jgi:hypothetical protein
MHPLVRAAAAIAVLSAIGMLDKPRHAPASTKGTLVATPGTPSLTQMPCGPRSIPEGDVCVPLPETTDPLGAANGEPHARVPGARSHDLIPRRPDRPSDPLSLAYPFDPPVRLLFFGPEATGDEPADPASALTEGAVDLAAERGAPVKLVTLEGQEGKAEVIALGDLFGTTVVTLHQVSEGGRKRQYLVFHGRLDAIGPEVAVDKMLDGGSIVGFAGDSGTVGQVHLHLEVRQVREDLDVRPLELRRMIDQSVSIPSDVRNVFVSR